MESPVPAPAFVEFVASESRSLLRAAWLLTGEWASAEDLVQEALIRAWPKWASIRRVDDPGVYVRRIVVNLFLNDRRRRRFTVVAATDEPDANDGFAQREDRDQLLRTLSALPPRQRATIALRYLDDYSERQAAAIMGCSVGTVKSNTAKALHALRRMPGIADVDSQEAHP